MTKWITFGLLFVAWVGEAPREFDYYLYSGLWRSPFETLGFFFVPLPGVRLVLWQLLLIAMVPVCLATPGAFRHRSRELDAAIFVSLGAVVLTVLWGWSRGGGMYQSYYQLWRFLTALLMGFVLASVIRSPRDLRQLALVIIAAALIRGVLVIYFYWAHVHDRMSPRPDYMTNHDDSLLFVTAILIVVSWAIQRRRSTTWLTALFVTLFLSYSMVLNDRRIAWVELVLAALAIYFLFGPGPLRRRINRWALMAAPLVLAYVAIGWGREGAWFAPIQALSSTGSNDDQSSLARQEEVRNLIYTLTSYGNPLLGTGWGLPYEKLTTIYNQYSEEWVLAFYTPHNSLLGLAVFGGLAGILGIWCVMPVAAFLAARGFVRATGPTERASAMVAIGVLVGYGVHAYGDIGFQSFACGLILGAGLATAGKVAAWGALNDARSRAAAASNPGRALDDPPVRLGDPISGVRSPGVAGHSMPRRATSATAPTTAAPRFRS